MFSIFDGTDLYQTFQVLPKICICIFANDLSFQTDEPIPWYAECDIGHVHVSWLKLVWTKDVCKPSTGTSSPLDGLNCLEIKRDSDSGTLSRFFSNQAGKVLRSCFLGGSSLSRFPLTRIPPSVLLSLESASTAFCDVDYTRRQKIVSQIGHRMNWGNDEHTYNVRPATLRISNIALNPSSWTLVNWTFDDIRVTLSLST